VPDSQLSYQVQFGKQIAHLETFQKKCNSTNSKIIIFSRGDKQKNEWSEKEVPDSQLSYQVQLGKQIAHLEIFQKMQLDELKNYFFF
jgi:hypothetical protein